MTTFTIGLAVIAMAYTFFARRVNPVFGLIAGLVLITDYVFFAQWQVNADTALTLMIELKQRVIEQRGPRDAGCNGG